jgi:tRNA-dihydrouridine synthase
MDAFAYAAENSRAPLCYNGDLGSKADIDRISKAFPNVDAVMLGRGLIRDPGMLTPGGTTIAALEGFYEELLEEYLIAFGGSRNAMFRLKEHWGLLITRFANSEKLAKRLRKTTDLAEYKAITAEIFHTVSLK